MTGARRGPSLLWTIAGMFLLTAVLGTALQALVAIAVLQPLEGREENARAELAAARIAVELTLVPPPLQSPRVDSLLEWHWDHLGTRRASIVFQAHDGHRSIAPPGREHFIEPFLNGDRAAERRTDTATGHDSAHEIEIAARHPVVRGTDNLGEVIVVRPVRNHRVLPFLNWEEMLLSLPIAAFTSIIAGLVLVRLLLRRLRGLDVLAARVAEGDLTVRVADLSGDEIGRLAGRFDRMTERLAEARRRLDETESQRRQLFADITHELATPLTSIRGYAETLDDPHVPLSNEERARYVRGVLAESQRLGRLVRDLFELARLEAGASPLEKEALDLAALCRNTAQRFEPRFRAAGLGLVWHGLADELWIEADGHRMVQVLENLLVNALRYVPPGGSVEIALQADPGAAGRVALIVSDDGPGLATEDLAHVFERFYRAADAHGVPAARDGGGSGLGLAIVREIVQRHGGSVHAEARSPRGLRIVVELPVP
jgi:signal transduction histidine kinase